MNKPPILETRTEVEVEVEVEAAIPPENNREESQASQKMKAYSNQWHKLLTQYAILGFLSGIAISYAIPGLVWSGLGPIFGVFFGLRLAYKKAFINPCDLTDWQIALLASHRVETQKENEASHTSLISPFNPDQVEPDSYDVLLSDHFYQRLPGNREKQWDAQEITLEPNQSVLAHTQEVFSFPANIKGVLQGKSSWARLSLFVECAGLFDKGFQGTAVLELYNAGTNPITLKKGDRIAQMSFHRTLPATFPYGHPLRANHYQKQEGAKKSWLTN